ncbi:hypothetical protein TVAG_390970 [Trichomonas vaginalis G3]|uniref:Cilia- and flagella-associated protein 300 n=1 Tax=Trichomonas vaginalis (strain ATCC PRA-98 / G3) TaxID=412133 RepID=A2DFL1_TRIV3|nr:protein of unknown function (DUF4498) family [Trichomonas vaginalis G3]EAY20714.1 hypothetical protein TVAG_390970 [Trichomonas vaginalis G3]KAI5528729.1 protein of unknown function (DUF4498) family [Trichomonas vaginalis G3]|eukprot:XP_001581700.1 hypothetical protein [Trichomonas vaginalis G3]
MSERWEFTELDDNGFKTWADKEKMKLINEKWGLNGIKARTFSYNGELPVPFNPETFFKSFLNTKGIGSEEVKEVDVEPLSAISIGNKFWKKLWTPPNNICRNATGHYINKCPDHHVHGMWLSDCLQVALLDEDSEEYEVFTPEDRRELLFHVIKLLVLGGEICQYEDEWDTYEPVITSLYRDLIGQSVVKNTSGAISIVARPYLLKKTNGKSILGNPDHSACILVIDTVGKKVRMLQYLAYP